MCESSTRYELQIEFYSFCYSKHWIIHSSSSPFIQAWHDETQPWILLEQWVYWKWYPFFNHHYSSLCHRCHRHVNLQYELDTNLRRANCISNFIILYGKLQMWWGPCSGPGKCWQRVRIDTALVPSPNISEVDSPCCVLLLLNVRRYVDQSENSLLVTNTSIVASEWWYIICNEWWCITFY